MSDEAARPTYPSVFWERLRELLPAVQPIQVLREMQSPRDIRRIATPRQLLGSLMQWAREEAPVGPALRTDSPADAAEGQGSFPSPGSGSRPRYSGGGLGRGSETTPSWSQHPPPPSPGVIMSLGSPAMHESCTPSPGTPGEGGGEGLLQVGPDPHPNPLPEYRAREREGRDRPVVSCRAVPGAGVESDPRAALYQWLVTRYPGERAGASAGPPDAIAAIVARAWPALSYSNEARLPEGLARELFPTPLHASVAQMETFAACPFRHFVRYGVRLTAGKPIA